MHTATCQIFSERNKVYCHSLPLCNQWPLLSGEPTADKQVGERVLESLSSNKAVQALSCKDVLVH